VSKGLTGQYENFAKENKGMFRITALDCEQFSSVCTKEGVTKFPTFRVYPAFPAPAQDYEEEGAVDFEKVKKLAAKFVGNRVVDVNQNNFDTFVNDNPGKPKVLLFSDKKGIPLIFKALSTHFDKTLLFGLVRETETALASKYKVKSFPAVFLLKDKDSKPQKYEGKEYNYQAIFDFINIYSETFVFKNNNEESVVSAASKPWLSEKVPQVASESFDDICLKKEGAICVIYIAAGADKVKQDQLNELYSLGQQFASKISRGINFSFMWLDASAETQFAGIFDVATADLPKVVILNPGKRKRFLVHQGAISEGEVGKTLDRILGGDAKFVNIKGN
jgi:thioredoxin-like negative regulator of GroEL